MPGVALLLGAGGFLGGHIAGALRGAGWTVRAAPRGDLSTLPPDAWDDLLGGAGAVINAAGRTAGTLPELTRANVLLPALLLDAAGRAGTRMVHLASAAEYGRTPEGHAAREDDPCTPLSPYGATKLAGTLLLEEAVRAGRVDAVALRLTNPLGAGMNAGSLPGRAARELAQTAREGGQSVKFGPLGALRDFVDARDVARAVLHTLPGELGDGLRGTVNVGSGEARPVRDLVTELTRLTGFGGVVHEDAPGSPRSGDVPYQRADVSRLTASGFQPHFTFTDSLQALLASPTTVSLPQKEF